MSARSEPALPGPAVDVTAVLVAHDGAVWLPEVLSCLAASTSPPRRVICVDTGSIDTSRELLQAAHGSVLSLPRGTGYGAAVAAGLVGAAPAGWVWLLHDDCAVEPGTLSALLAHAADSPSAVLLGPKVRDWADPRVLVEVGVTTDAAGHRETGLERQEYDQGQHDAVRDVLAVGTAGALIRRDVWDALGGLDASLPVFRDDLDLGWRVNAAGHRVVVVPQARVRHARAATTGRRSEGAATGRATGIDRRNALFVLLAHAGMLRLLVLLPWLTFGTLVRALALLLTRQVGAAGDELRAIAGVLGHPARLASARRARAATRTVSNRALRPLFASRSGRLRARAGALGDWLSGGAAPGVSALGEPGPEGPGELDELSTAGGGTVRRLLLRPGVLLPLLLALIALVAERDVLSVAGGVLSGGRLLPAPDGAAELWAAYAGAWHPSTVGSPALAPPALAVLAVLATLLFGKAWLAVDVLLLASVPLAAAAAYVAASRVVRHMALRVWAAATWALLPVATGAVASGRLDVAAGQVAVPLLAVAVARVLQTNPRLAGWRRAWALGLGLSVAAAFEPVLWPLTAAVLLAGALLAGWRRRPAAALAAAIAAVVPGLLLLPWSLEALQHPALLLIGSGRLDPTLVDPALPPWQLPLLSPGGPGRPAVGVTAGLLLAAVGGLLRRTRHRLALTAWAVAGLGLVAALLLARRTVTPPGATAAVALWPGGALQVAGVGLLLAALVGADGVRTRLARSAFGWRQLTAGLVVVAAAVGPVLAAGALLRRSATDPLRRDLRPLLPAFAEAELAASPGLRVLVLAPGVRGQLAYELAAAGGNRLGAADLPPAAGQTRRLDEIVADLLSPRGSDAAEALSTRAVRYVAVRGSALSRALAPELDAQAGLVRRAGGGVLLWQVVAPAGRLSVLSPALAGRALSGARAPTVDLLRTDRPSPVPAGPEGARGRLSAGPPGRLLVLAEAADPGWRARLDGRLLPRRTAWGWAQGFVLPAGGGRFVLTYAQTRRHTALGIEAGLLMLVAVLAAPGGRRRRGLEDDDDVEQQDAS